MKKLVILLILTVIIGCLTSYADVYVIKKKDGRIVLTNIYSPNLMKNVKYFKIIKTNRANGQRRIPVLKNKNIKATLKNVAKQFNLDYHLLLAIAKVESNFNHNVRSNKGAIGLMQIMPQTAKRFGIKNPYNLKQNILAAAKYLKYLLKLFKNNIILATAAYNAGENNVIKYKGIPPYRETKSYVHQVISYYKKLKLNEKSL
jgi:soluble lytic murein transglycosylase-like protein